MSSKASTRGTATIKTIEFRRTGARGRAAMRSRAVLLRQAELAGVGLAFVAALAFVAVAFGNADALFAGI
jgi:hypothetical protein